MIAFVMATTAMTTGCSETDIRLANPLLSSWRSGDLSSLEPRYQEYFLDQLRSALSQRQETYTIGTEEGSDATISRDEAEQLELVLTELLEKHKESSKAR
ncbi:MAG: hypothetical protein AAF628_32860 [Planctomycetota bacterium]